VPLRSLEGHPKTGWKNCHTFQVPIEPHALFKPQIPSPVSDPIAESSLPTAVLKMRIPPKLAN
jgi:hypothetical protein